MGAETSQPVKRGGIGPGHELAAPAVMVLLVAVVLFVTMPRSLYPGDPLAIQCASVNLLEQGRVDVDYEHARLFGARGQYFFENEQSGRWYPKFGLLNTLLLVPPLAVEKLVKGKLSYWHELELEEPQLADTDRPRRLRTFFFDLYYVVISLVVAIYLYGIATRYVELPWIACLFVMLCMFCTFMWNYARAQTVEIFQLWFFCGHFFHLTNVRRAAGSPGAQVLLSMLYLGLLVGSKLVFCLLVPLALAAWLLVDYRPGTNQNLLKYAIGRLKTDYRFAGTFLVLPLLLIAALVLTANWYRFGSPWSAGYEQWEVERNYLSGNLSEGVYGFLLNPQKSIFLYFPLLPVSLFGLRPFARKYTFDLLFAYSVFVVFLLANAQFVGWAGAWCYGPRYLLFVLPLVSLPVLELLSRMVARPLGLKNLAIAALVSLVCGWSCWAQWQINRVTFFGVFLAMTHFKAAGDEEVDRYFSRPIWQINREMLALREYGRPFAPLEMLKNRLTAEEYHNGQRLVRMAAEGNLFWFDDSQQSAPR